MAYIVTLAAIVTVLSMNRRSVVLLARITLHRNRLRMARPSLRLSGRHPKSHRRRSPAPPQTLKPVRPPGNRPCAHWVARRRWWRRQRQLARPLRNLRVVFPRWRRGRHHLSEWSNSRQLLSNRRHPVCRQAPRASRRPKAASKRRSGMHLTRRRHSFRPRETPLRLLKPTCRRHRQRQTPSPLTSRGLRHPRPPCARPSIPRPRRRPRPLLTAPAPPRGRSH